MKKTIDEIKLETVGAISGFEGNNAAEILNELSEMNPETLKALFKSIYSSIEICFNTPNLPQSVIDHLTALNISIMQELTTRG